MFPHGARRLQIAQAILHANICVPHPSRSSCFSSLAHHCRAAGATAATWTAIDAMLSDLFHIAPTGESLAVDTFYCGNFGIILFRKMQQKQLFGLLRKMLRVTMVRGAQSAGLVTYTTASRGSRIGLRSRVVNGKRTDLSELLLAKFRRDMSGQSSSLGATGPQLFQGHTRFATSSICNLTGCHPHQWTPRRQQIYWRHDGGARFVGESRSVEGFITHNGDLDFFVLHGQTLPLCDVQRLLARLLGRKAPSDVDSAAIAGLLELFRTKGLWLASVRYACESLPHPS